MRLAGNDNLYRHLGIVEKSLEPLDVPENQRCSFISSKTPCEPDGEDVRIENLLQAPHLSGGCLARHSCICDPLPDIGHHTAFPLPVHFPDFLAWNLVNELPHFRVFETLTPIRLQVLVVEACEITIDPGGGMNAVRDRGNWHFVYGQASPQVLEHLLRHGP